MSQNILVAICSSHLHAARREAVRDTWLRRLPTTIQARFFLGDGPNVTENDSVLFPVDDSYEALPAKVQAFFQHALEHYDFDYLFKCDEDTYLYPTRLQELVAPNCELLGSQDGAQHCYAYGGAGYLLTRRAVQIVAQAPTPETGAEDVWVSRTLIAAGIKPYYTPRLVGTRRDFPRPTNDLVTSHHCSPALLRLIDEGFDNPEAITVAHSFTLETPVGTWSVNLLRNGVFASTTNGLLGRWRHFTNEEAIELEWSLTAKAPDVLRKSTTGYENADISLTPMQEHRLQAGICLPATGERSSA